MQNLDSKTVAYAWRFPNRLGVLLVKNRWCLYPPKVSTVGATLII